MPTRSLLAASVLVVAGAALFMAPACKHEREDVPGPGSGSGNAPGGTNPANGSTGNGDGGSSASGNDQGGDGGDRSDGTGGGVGGGPLTLPECACLLDISRTDACGTCVSFGVVDECSKLYTACQSDGDCVAIDNCILDQKCTNSGCIDACRDLGTPEALDAFEAMYACACSLCNSDCDNGDACR